MLFRSDDGWVAVSDVILRKLALIFLHLLREEVRAEGLLQNRIPHVFLIPKYTGVDTMCAVGANGCIVGASMGAYQNL